MEPKEQHPSGRTVKRPVQRNTGQCGTTEKKVHQKGSSKSTDPSQQYRSKEAAAESARERYYKDNPQKITVIAASGVTDTAINAKAEAVAVTNIITNKDEMIQGLSVVATSKLIGKTYKTLKAWIDKGIVPAPIYSAIDRPEFRYFTPSEVSALVKVLHNADTRYLKTTSPLVSRLFKALQRIRP